MRGISTLARLYRRIRKPEPGETYPLLIDGPYKPGKNEDCYVSVVIDRSRLREARIDLEHLHPVISIKADVARRISSITKVAVTKDPVQGTARDQSRSTVVNDVIITPTLWNGQIVTEIALHAVGSDDAAKPYLKLLRGLGASAGVPGIGTITQAARSISDTFTDFRKAAGLVQVSNRTTHVEGGRWLLANEHLKPPFSFVDGMLQAGDPAKKVTCAYVIYTITFTRHLISDLGDVIPGYGELVGMLERAVDKPTAKTMMDECIRVVTASSLLTEADRDVEVARLRKRHEEITGNIDSRRQKAVRVRATIVGATAGGGGAKVDQEAPAPASLPLQDDSQVSDTGLADGPAPVSGDDVTTTSIERGVPESHPADGATSGPTDALGDDTHVIEVPVSWSWIGDRARTFGPLADPTAPFELTDRQLVELLSPPSGWTPPPLDIIEEVIALLEYRPPIGSAGISFDMVMADRLDASPTEQPGPDDGI